MRDPMSAFAEDFDKVFGRAAERPVTPDEELKAALSLGWLEPTDDGHVITDAGVEAKARGDKYLLREDGGPVLVRRGNET